MNKFGYIDVGLRTDPWWVQNKNPRKKNQRANTYKLQNLWNQPALKWHILSEQFYLQSCNLSSIGVSTYHEKLKKKKLQKHKWMTSKKIIALKKLFDLSFLW